MAVKMETVRTASAAEVIWAYVANEHASKRVLPDVAEQLELDAESCPEGLSVEAILSAIAGKEVHETAGQLSRLCWEVRTISTVQLQQVHVHVAGPVPAPLIVSSACWQAYLNQPDANAQRARAHYDSVLGRVRAGKPFRFRPIVRRHPGDAFAVADGKHRLLAFWQERAGTPEAVVGVYWEIPCPAS